MLIYFYVNCAFSEIFALSRTRKNEFQTQPIQYIYHPLRIYQLLFLEKASEAGSRVRAYMDVFTASFERNNKL